MATAAAIAVFPRLVENIIHIYNEVMYIAGENWVIALSLSLVHTHTVVTTKKV